jgi:transposase InsO family protein
VNVHKNARLTPAGRALLVARVLEGREPVQTVATALGVSRRTAWKWVGRYRAEGRPGLLDRSSRPHRSPTRLAEPLRAEIAALRRARRSSLAIARRLGLPLWTVVRHQRQLGYARLPRAAPGPPVVRYERERAGELVHLDTKKLGRITQPGHRAHGDRLRRAHGKAGWEHVHVAVDDATRLAYAEVLPTPSGAEAAGFLARMTAWFAARGVPRVERVMTDNGGTYVARAFRGAVAGLGARHMRIRPRTPRTNGKAERLIRTLLAEWAYGELYHSSRERSLALAGYLEYYNTKRPHTALGFIPPQQRLTALSEQRPA